MSTPFSMERIIIADGGEKRVDADDNLFEITYEGYKIFPMNELLEIKRKLNSNQIGSAIIEELLFSQNTTTCRYRLISLYSVN